MIDDCDFCGRLLEEDEETVPLYLGEIPDPKPIITRGFSEKIFEQRLVVSTSSNGLNETVERAERVDKIISLLKAIENTDRIEVDFSQRVYESEPFEFHGEDDINLSYRDFNDGINDDKVGVAIRVEPRRENIQPTMEVCEYCEKSFKGESQRPIGDIIATD